MSEPTNKPRPPVLSQPPLTVSDVPPSAERRLSSGIQGLAEYEPYPGGWADRLLVAVSTVSVDAGIESVVGHILDAVSDVLPDHSFGVCISGPRGRTLVRRGPLASQREPAPPDPSRLFPERRFERSLPIDEAEECTFHVGFDGSSLVLDVGADARFVERAAAVLAGVIRQASVTERARTQSAELRELQAQVIQSEKLASLGQLAAGVVHELNNPLTSIVAYSDYLRKKGEREGRDTSDLERLRRIGEAADRILRFSRDLVDYARPSSGVATQIVIEDVVEQSLVFCEHVLGHTGVVVERRYAAGVPRVIGVASELTQVLVNLVTNACHAMPEVDGRLVVATAVEDDVVHVELMDNGHGIAPDLLGKVFEPFFTTKSEGRGTGLGLSIVRNIVARHGGGVRVESDGENGSKFILSLPASPL